MEGYFKLLWGEEPPPRGGGKEGGEKPRGGTGQPTPERGEPKTNGRRAPQEREYGQGGRGPGRRRKGGEKYEDPQVIAEKADIVVDRDELERGRTIPELAKQMGATKFIHYSFPRHMSIPLISQRRDRFKEECERLGMEFIEVSSPDPTGPDGIPGTQKFILEDVPLQVQTHGKRHCSVRHQPCHARTYD